MKSGVIIALFKWSAAAALMFSPNPVSVSAFQQQDDAMAICKVSTIPSGYVIVGKTTLEQCRQTSDIPERDNAWLIKKPAPREIICEKSPYPNTYVVTARVRFVACPNNSEENYNNAWIIEHIK